MSISSFYLENFYMVPARFFARVSLVLDESSKANQDGRKVARAMIFMGRI
jgi:hypothetical protein